MTEVTRVPLKPIAKGSLTKLWLGVIVAVLLGGGLAWAALPKTLSVDTITASDGQQVEVGDVVFVKYRGTLASNGEEFDKYEPIPWPVGDMFPEGTPFPVEEGATIPGFFEGLQEMKKGGKYELYIPSDKGYGDQDQPDQQTGEIKIPANSDLIFEVEVVDIMPSAEFERNMQIQQAAAMQQQQEAAGAAGGPGGQGAPPPGAGQ